MVTFTVFKGHESGKVKKSTVSKPDELEGDQVRLKITASGLCGTGASTISPTSHHLYPQKTAELKH